MPIMLKGNRLYFGHCIFLSRSSDSLAVYFRMAHMFKENGIDFIK